MYIERTCNFHGNILYFIEFHGRFSRGAYFVLFKFNLILTESLSKWQNAAAHGRCRQVEIKLYVNIYVNAQYRNLPGDSCVLTKSGDKKADIGKKYK